jgi:hypothetical protein
MGVLRETFVSPARRKTLDDGVHRRVEEERDVVAVLSG